MDINYVISMEIVAVLIVLIVTIAIKAYAFCRQLQHDKNSKHNFGHRNDTTAIKPTSSDKSNSNNEDLSAAYSVITKKSCDKKISKTYRRNCQQKHRKSKESATTMPLHLNQATKAKVRQKPNTYAKGTVSCKPALETSKLTTKFKTTISNSSIGNYMANTSMSLSYSSSAGSSAMSSPSGSPITSKRKADNLEKLARALTPPLRQHIKLNLHEHELVSYLQRYIIDPNLLRVYGYPVESNVHEGCIEIYKCLPKPGGPSDFSSSASSSNVINARDGLFVPKYPNKALNCHLPQLSSDSGLGSATSSPASVDLDSSEGGDEDVTTAFYTSDGRYQIFSQYDKSTKKQCIRCKKSFHVTEKGEYLTTEKCIFHWGKLNQMYMGNKGFVYIYSCCGTDVNSQGCSLNDLHVWAGYVIGINGPYTDFIHTRPKHSTNDVCRSNCCRTRKVYALDSEMSFTGLGLELTKITVVGYDGQMVYEHFVRPQSEIVDYNTRFSGITQKDLYSKTSTAKSLNEVQNDLLQIINADTLLIGHGLENDLRVLRIVHKNVIDTSIAFPHASGFPYRRALKNLTKVFLGRDIQTSDSGHSSFEDSRACLELMLWKVRKECRIELEQ